MKQSVPCFGLWMILSGLCWLLGSSAGESALSPLAGCAVTGLPVLAAMLTAHAMKAQSEAGWRRIGFWILTLGGWASLLILIEGRAELHPAERASLLMGVAAAVFVWVGVALEFRALPSPRMLGEIGIAAAILALGIALLDVGYEARTRSIARQADAHWTEIGLPMAEFEKTVALARENEGSRVLREVLRERVNSPFYKHGTRVGKLEPTIEHADETDELIKEAVGLIGAPLPPSDDLDLSSQPIAALESTTPALDRDYERLLQATAPKWASDPHEGYEMSVPNFVGLRQFTQVIAADSMHRLWRGDQDAASRALTAGLRLRDALRQNPTLVSLMMGVAIDGLISSESVRLPASENGLAAIAREAADLRAEFIRRLQTDAWVALRVARQLDCAEAEFFGERSQLLPHWLASPVDARWYRHEFANAALNGADHVAIQRAPRLRNAPDLGASRHEAVCAANPSTMESNNVRALMRIYATLLLREQVELIRDARSRLALGQGVESHESVVMPGLRWELAADAQKATVSTRLVNAPEWIVTKRATGPHFWALPIDGSVAWQFHRGARTASRD